MRTPHNTGRKPTTRFLVVVVIVLWVAAATLAGYYIWHSKDDASAAGTALDTGSTTSASSTASTASFALTSTTEISTTTTSLAPPVLTVAAGGDVMGDRKVGKFLDKNGGAVAFAGVKPYMEGADLAFVNLEGAISDQGSRNTAKEYTFRSRPALLDGLLSAGINMVSLANNHSLDYGWKALSDCILRLSAAGIKYAGAGAESTAAGTPATFQTPAGSVAFIAASEITVSFAAGSQRAGTYYTSSPNKGLLANVASAAAEADFVIVSLHWGTEYKANANSHQISLAHSLVDAGADLILGHHPHVIQGIEIYKDRLIVYSLGDFVFDHYSRATGEAFVLQVTIPPEGPPSGRVIPVYLSDSYGIPAVVTGWEADNILDRLAKLSAARGLQLVRDGDIATFGAPPVTQQASAPIVSAAGSP